MSNIVYTNTLISEKDHQKEEFDLDETVSDFRNIIIQKSIVQQNILLYIISAANNENLIQETIKNRKKSR